MDPESHPVHPPSPPSESLTPVWAAPGAGAPQADSGGPVPSGGAPREPAPSGPAPREPAPSGQAPSGPAPREPDAGGPAGRAPRGPGRAAIAAIAFAAAVFGAGVVVAVLAAAGDLHGGGQTTVVAPSSTTSGVLSASTSGRGVSALYARVAPGIVDLTVQSAASGGGGFFGSGTQTDLGSGFEVDGSGHILTAAHVVDGATSITVTFQNGTTRTAQLLGEDRAWDVAVVKVNPAGIVLHPLALGSSRSLVVGDYLAAIGDPFGYDRSLSTGVVAGLDRTISAPNGFNIAYAIQTDAALNPGNSGGPVLDANGSVVGIADQIATDTSGTGSDTATSSGVGFAVPIDLARIDLPSLERSATIQHAYLGVSTTDAPDDSGVLLQGVQAGTPAAAAGLQSGDVLVSFNGHALHGSADLIDEIATEVPGDHVTLVVKRGGAQHTVTVTLGTQPSEAPSSG